MGDWLHECQWHFLLFIIKNQKFKIQNRLASERAIPFPELMGFLRDTGAAALTGSGPHSIALSTRISTPSWATDHARHGVPSTKSGIGGINDSSELSGSTNSHR